MCHCYYYNTFPSPLLSSLLLPTHTREPWRHLGDSNALFSKRTFDEARIPYFPWFKGFWGLFCSWPVGWELLCRDVSPGASVWMSMRGAGLLEGKDRRGRACHHPWIHHDNRNILQGRMNQVSKRQLGGLALWGRGIKLSQIMSGYSNEVHRLRMVPVSEFRSQNAADYTTNQIIKLLT